MASQKPWPYCRNGHDKSEVGTVGSQSACLLCHANTARRQRRMRGVLPREEARLAPEGIPRARRLLDLSAAEMARRLGCHASHYRGVEKRKRKATSSFVGDVLEVLYEEMRRQGLEKIPVAAGTPERIQLDEFGKPRCMGRQPCRTRALAALRKRTRAWGEGSLETEMSSAEVAAQIGCSRSTASMALKECHEAGLAERRPAASGAGNPMLYRAAAVSYAAGSRISKSRTKESRQP